MSLLQTYGGHLPYSCTKLSKIEHQSAFFGINICNCCGSQLNANVVETNSVSVAISDGKDNNSDETFQLPNGKWVNIKYTKFHDESGDYSSWADYYKV